MTWPCAVLSPRGPNRSRGWAWPENCSVIGRARRGSEQSLRSCSTMPAPPAPYWRGSWPTKHSDSALVLIDYQKEMFETIRSETSPELADLNVRLLARTAEAFTYSHFAAVPNLKPAPRSTSLHTQALRP